MNPTDKSGGLQKPQFMTRLSLRISRLRLAGHDTYGCAPDRSSVAIHHAVVSGDTAKVVGMTSLIDIAEANITGASREGVLTP